MFEIISQNAWLPPYTKKTEHIYILITSLNLGGAEKIVSDQLWANYYSSSPKKVTLLVIYDKLKEHSFPPGVNIVRLNNNILNAKLILNQIAYEEKPLVCHLINDEILNYIFDFGINVHLVIHNDKKAWPNSLEMLNHPQIISLCAVADFVKKQLQEIAPNKIIYKFRHQIKEHLYKYNEEQRIEKRKQLNIKDTDIIIGMTGRICQQKNYFLALDVLSKLITINPNYKLVIVGGFEASVMPLYTQLLHKANTLKLHKNIHLLGFQTNAYDWINIFDIALNTSYFEGLSMATQELMRNGLHMVLSNVCGQPEILDPLKQLHFFDLPENTITPLTNQYDINTNIHDVPDEEQEILLSYQTLIHDLSNKICSIIPERIFIDEDNKKELDFLCYGSHGLWNLLNDIYPTEKTNEINPLFITSDLNAGGAQRSLINLLKEFKNNHKNIPLALLNQSNQHQYFNELNEFKIEYFLCEESRDVFNISTSLFNYIHRKKINKIIFWNVDSKMKLLISKFFSAKIKIIDVSPGDYILTEMNNEKTFQQAIYYSEKEYFSELEQFVSKYDNSSKNEPYKQYLKKNVKIIPNGIPQEQSCANHNYLGNPTKFRLMVCGRITPSKHLETIFSAWKKFVNLNPEKDLLLDVYGNVEPCYLEYYNGLNETFKENIGNNITWKGYHLEPKKIMPLYQGIIVLGTHQGSPNTVLEAASVHLPIIANDSGGTKEIINEKTGILLPEKPDVDILFAAINEMYHNYDQAWVKATACYSFIQLNFSMAQMQILYEEIIYEN